MCYYAAIVADLFVEAFIVLPRIGVTDRLSVLRDYIYYMIIYFNGVVDLLLLFLGTCTIAGDLFSLLEIDVGVTLAFQIEVRVVGP